MKKKKKKIKSQQPFSRGRAVPVAALPPSVPCPATYRQITRVLLCTSEVM